MKIITILLLTAMPLATLAQPTVTHNEFYHIGDNIVMTNCDTTGVRGGNAGAGVTWDFSGLVAAGTYSYSVANNTTGMFPTADIVITFSDGTQQFIQENSTDSRLNGYIDGMGDTITYNMLTIAHRPFTYNSFYNDSEYQMNIPANGTHGGGSLTLKGDGYGTLKLPTGNFSNVLRIKEVREEGDSAIGDTTFFTITSYLWFDTATTAPLLRIDSLIGVNPTTRVRYLSTPSAVNSVALNNATFTAALTADQLFIKSDMQQGQEYKIEVRNIVGQTVYEDEFIASGNEQRFNTNAQLSNGIYVIGLTHKNSNASTKFIKVVKQ